MLSVPGLGAFTRSDPRDPLHSTLYRAPSRWLLSSNLSLINISLNPLQPLCIATSHLCPSFSPWASIRLSISMAPYSHRLTALLSLDHLFTTPARPGDLLVVPISTAACVVPDPNALAPKGRPSSPLLPSKGTRHDQSATGRLPPVPALTSAPRPRPPSALLTEAARLATRTARHYSPLAPLARNAVHWRASRRDRGSKTPGRGCSRNRKLRRSSRSPPPPPLQAGLGYLGAAAMTARGTPSRFLASVLHNGLGRYVQQLQRLSFSLSRDAPSSRGAR